ncbi:E3 SUMO-protein ligase ZNF451-like [Mantella aurantiaca]
MRTLCRNAGPVCVSEKSIADVASVFQLKAFCLTCKQGLSSDTHMAKHTARTGHIAKRVTSIEESILAFCYLNEGTKTPSDFCLSAASARLKHCSLKRSLTSADVGGVLSKRAKKSETEDVVKREGGVTVNAWFCECSQRFPTENAAEKHIMAANQISHKCMVCGKLADDPAIIRLHMCRIHGGARLDSFHFWCQLCATELARIENVFVHIIDCHGGHSFYYEREVSEEPATSLEMEVTSEVLGEEPSWVVPGGEPSSKVPGGEPSSEVLRGEPSWEVPGGEPSSEVPGGEPSWEVPGGEPSSEVLRGEPSWEVPGGEPSSEVPGGEPSWEVPGGQPSWEVPGGEPSSEVPGGELSSEVLRGQPSSEVLGGEPSSEVLRGEPSSEVLGGEPSSEVLRGQPSWEVPGVEPSLPEGEGSWQCHICEEMFDTEAAVMDHCKSPTIHQFHKYACDTCKMKFHKMETLLRHCQLQHNGDIRLKYFCGLCKDLYLNEQEAFQGHYESFHSLDYSYVPNPGQADLKLPDTTSRGEELTCGCLAKYSFKGQKKAEVKRCLEKLFGKGKLWYNCSSCAATAQTIDGITAHVCKTAQTDDRKMAVKCSVCSKSFAEAKAAQTHYHMKHSFLKETRATYHFPAKESNKGMFRFTASGTSAHQPRARTQPNRVPASHAEHQSCTANLKAKPNRVPASHAEHQSCTANLKAKPNRVPASNAKDRSVTASLKAKPNRVPASHAEHQSCTTNLKAKPNAEDQSCTTSLMAKPNRVPASNAKDRSSTASLKAKPNRLLALHAEDRSSTASLKAKPNRVPAFHAEDRSSTISPDANTSQKGATPEAMEIQTTDTEPQNCDLPDLDFLRTMTHIVFIDLDNWCQFFSSLPGFLNQGTFVWGFQGGKTAWKPPVSCKFFKHLSNTGCFFLHPRCSDRKDAADFAICMHVRIPRKREKQEAQLPAVYRK